MTDQELRLLIEGSTVIAVVGASTNEEKAAHRIPKLLLEHGFTVIPVNPSVDEILGQKAYGTLAEIPVAIDIVDVFRPSDEAPDIAAQAEAHGAKTLWLQMGITSLEARAIAEAGAMNYIENLCLGETVKRLDLHPAAS